MTTYKLAPLKAVAVRVTALDACGVPLTSTCATFSSKNLISIEQAAETIDEVEFPLVNADGDLEEYFTDPSRLKYLTLDMIVSKAVPELVGWMTGADVIRDNATSPSAIGWRTQTNAATLGNFALEVWTRLSGVSACSGAAYGYVVWPWLVGGTMYETKIENGLSELKITTKTQAGSPWGVGPYSINLSKAAATLGQPMGLFEAVLSDDHRHFQRTELAPPLQSVDCSLVVGTLAVVDDDTVGAGLAATATLPTPTASLTPGYISWGDATPPAAVAAAATTATHTYSGTGTYTVSYRPSAQSGVVYTGTVTMA